MKIKKMKMDLGRGRRWWRAAAPPAASRAAPRAAGPAVPLTASPLAARLGFGGPSGAHRLAARRRHRAARSEVRRIWSGERRYAGGGVLDPGRRKGAKR